MLKIALYIAVSLSFLISGCSEAPDEKLVNAATGTHRSAENIARNATRHSIETLQFFGLKDTMTVMEVWPGSGGWYSEILAPYLRENGTFYAANFNGSTGVQYFENAAAKFQRKLGVSPDVYDKVKTVGLMPPNDITPVPENSVDLILTFRNLHNWVNGDMAEQMFEIFFKALKPGGTLGLVAHRGTDEMVNFDKGYTGYLAESVAINLAKNAGLELVAKSEINANPKDTKDYSDGVWTLPPNFKKGDLDKEKYAAIGESDRMTLKFRKPKDEKMTVVRVLFDVEAGADIDALQKKMLASAVKYEGLEGLTRKYYVWNDDQSTVGGIYLWESRAVAEAWYNEAWFATMTKAWGKRPFVEYLDTQIVVDNETKKTLTN